MKVRPGPCHGCGTKVTFSFGTPHGGAGWRCAGQAARPAGFAPPTAPCGTALQAVKTVDADKALGKPHSLWCAFAKFYERHGDVPNARIIFEKAVQVRARALRRRQRMSHMQLNHADQAAARSLAAARHACHRRWPRH